MVDHPQCIQLALGIVEDTIQSHHTKNTSCCQRHVAENEMAPSLDLHLTQKQKTTDSGGGQDFHVG
ncbi:MAG TPA: hypothetical protein PLU87_10955 [Sedimentisphaerales bacterium]|nr:hypothetical protein [Sedimentisphaerales bacterium]